jgi:hypothetical protein
MPALNGLAEAQPGFKPAVNLLSFQFLILSAFIGVHRRLQ